MNIKTYLLSVLLCLSGISMSINTFAGGGWPQKKHGLYLKLSQWWVIYNSYYDNFGNKINDRSRGIYNTSLYAEYGITKNLTGILYFPFYSVAVLGQEVAKNTGVVLAERDKISGVGDMDLSIKYGLIQKSGVAISTSLLLGFPLGVHEGGRDGSLQTGDGEFNQMIRVDASSSFKLGKYFPYTSIYTAYNNRSNNFSDEIRYGLEAGIVLKKLMIIVRGDAVKSLRNSDENFNQFNTGLNLNNAEYLNLSMELGYKITDKIGASLNYNKAVSGKLIFTDPSYSIGVFLSI